jgi:hypothetical protein
MTCKVLAQEIFVYLERHTTMKKRTLTVLLLQFVVFYALSLLLANVSSSSTLAALGTVCSLLGTVAGLIAWIGGLVKQARQRRWGWFVCTFLFGLLCLAIYLIVVPEAPSYRVYQPGQDYQPGRQRDYQPQPQQDAPYYYQPQPYQEPVPNDVPPQMYDAVPQQTYQEMVQPGSYQEAMKPEFYQERGQPEG